MPKNKRKTTTAVVASAAAALVLLGGTLAWTSISQQAKNEAVVDINPGGRLHDDFNGTNKDVYVENFGDEETGVPIFARIRLDEYMEVGQDAGKDKTGTDRTVKVLHPDGTPTPDIADPTTWLTYIPGDQDLTNDEVANADRVFAPYWNWALGQNDATQLPYYMPTFNKNKDSLKADINGTYEGTIGGDNFHYDDYHVYTANEPKIADATYDWDDNTVDEPVPVETRNENDPINAANILLKNETHNAKQISTTSTVITMQQWINGGKVPGPYWVYDTDGWAYWAQEILPGETTGLLLDGISQGMTPDDNWYYGINVVGQFTTAGDWEMFFAPEADGGAGETAITENGKELMRILTTPETIYVVVTDTGTLQADGTTPAYTLSFFNDNKTINVGDTYNGEQIVAIYEDMGKTYYELASPAPWFTYRQEITSASVDEVIYPRDISLWFYYMPNLTVIDGLENIDTSKTIRMRGTFRGASALTDLSGISGWDTSSVHLMESMFMGCQSLEELDAVSGWDVSTVDSMGHMFADCIGLDTLDLSSWNTSRLQSAPSLFRGCTGLTDVGDLNNWVTSSVTSMSAMFINCTSLENIGDISGWNTGNVVNMANMFNGCSNLANIGDLSGWETGKVTDMSNMFNGCASLADLSYVNGWNTGNVTTMANMFYGCTGLTTSLDLTDWETGNVKSINNMFKNCTSLVSVGDLKDWDVSLVENMNGMFQNCSALTSVGDISGWQTSNATEMNAMFNYCSAIAAPLDLSGWDVSGVTNSANFATGAVNITPPNFT